MRDFLDFIHGDQQGLVEVRTIRDGRVRQWWESDRQAAVDLSIQQSDEGWDAYYGVLARLLKSGDATAVSPTTAVLWADLDAKVSGSKQRCLTNLVGYPIPPSVVVDSGHGYHAYWKLDQFILYEQARLMMIGLAEGLKGDSVWDAPRILRIPGTTNWKDHDSPIPVRTIVFDTTNVMRPADFYNETEVGYAKVTPRFEHHPWSDKQHFDAAMDLPGWLDDLIRDGAPQGQRSEACWKVIKNLIEHGWTDDAIERAFDTGGIGEKMREKRDGQRWFQRSLAKARQQGPAS